MPADSPYDIIVVGAGLVGSSLVIALQNQGLRIAVLEKHLPQPLTNAKAKNSRPLSLALGSWRILNQLGITSQLDEYAKPIQQVHVSEEGVLGKVKFRAHELNVPALGYAVPAAILQQTLYQSAAQQAGVDILVSDELINIDTDEHGCTLCYQHQSQKKTIKATLLVGADGTHSTTRKLLGVGTKEKPHQEIARIFQVDGGNLPATTAIERFTKEGVIAVLPSTHQGRAVVWTMSEAQATQRQSWGDQDWLADFNKHLHTTQSVACTSIKALNQYPLITQTARQQCGKNWVLIGNAAHAFYPLAAQGFNLGLRSVATLAELIAESRLNKKNIDSEHILFNYGKARQKDQQAVSRLTSWLNEGFNVQTPLSSHIRGLSLLAIELCPPLKKRLAMRTMGLSLPLSKLARGLNLAEPGVNSNGN